MVRNVPGGGGGGGGEGISILIFDFPLPLPNFSIFLTKTKKTKKEEKKLRPELQRPAGQETYSRTSATRWTGNILCRQRYQHLRNIHFNIVY